jgi:hypothetical protein
VPAGQEYTKLPLQTGGSSYFMIENSLKQHFLQKPLTRYNSKTFYEE